MKESFLAILDQSPVLSSVFNNSTINAMQVMDEDGSILHVNDAFKHSFGYSTEDLQGKHSRVLFTEEDRSTLLPEREITQTNQKGFATDRNYIMHKDGSCIWVTGESTLTKDESGNTFIFKILQNIHEQKVLEKFLKESQEFSESVVKSIHDALVVIDTNYKILRINNAFYNFFDIQEGTIEGLNLGELKHPFFSSNEFLKNVDEIIETGAPKQFSLTLKGEDESNKTLMATGRFLDGKLVDKKLLIVFTDITETVQTQQYREDLISFVVHELRNPLANITLCTELLEESVKENDTETSNEYISKSKVAIHKINSLIRELYNAAKAESGNLQFDKSSFSFEELVKDAIDAVQLTHPTHKILKEGEADVELFADRGKIMQVISNYIINAIKYSPGATRVNVHVGIETGSVVVAVKDYGVGIDAADIDNVFKRYYRVDKSKKVEGLGLGLFLSKQIIDAHNGRVWAESKKNEGSIFYFTLPI